MLAAHPDLPLPTRQGVFQFRANRFVASAPQNGLESRIGTAPRSHRASSVRCRHDISKTINFVNYFRLRLAEPCRRTPRLLPDWGLRRGHHQSSLTFYQSSILLARKNTHKPKLRRPKISNLSRAEFS